jgi:hypothetical protein
MISPSGASDGEKSLDRLPNIFSPICSYCSWVPPGIIWSIPIAIVPPDFGRMIVPEATCMRGGADPKA